ncbi:MAG: hypothetical protein IJS90_06510 [Clostridia bacterium]|nr:hypothetical protein [Clostridia bacterium]
MNKEKAEIGALMDYISEMETALTGMLNEMKEMREEISLIHNSSVRTKCQNLIQKTENRIKRGLALVVRLKDNLIRSAGNALKTFKEKGKEAFFSAIKAMKIPETLDRLASFFDRLSKDAERDMRIVRDLRSELTGVKHHLKNVGTLLIFRTKRESEEIVQDKGVLSRLGRMLEKAFRGFGDLSQKARDKADQIREAHVRASVKVELETLKSIKTARRGVDPFRAR